MPTDSEGVDTRQRILDSAQALFLRQGYHGTTMRQIAGAAGIVPGAVYNHFGGKEDVYLALLRNASIYNIIGEALQNTPGDTVEQMLRHAAHRLVDALSQRSDRVALIFVDVLEFKSRNVAALVGEAIPEMVSFFSRVLTLDVQTGELRPMRVDVLARSYLGLFMSYFITTRFFQTTINQYPGINADADLVDDFLDVYLHGVLRKPKGE
jgi:AcrR family transcriptional regulator